MDSDAMPNYYVPNRVFESYCDPGVQLVTRRAAAGGSEQVCISSGTA